MRFPIAIYLLMLSSGIVHSAIYYPRLPGIMASHFGAAGVPNGWSSKPAYFLLEFVIVLILFAAFIGLPRALRALRPERIAIPNRQYWLAPSRREAAYDFFQTRLCWMASVNMLFLIIVNHLVFKANETPGGVLDSRIFVIALALYFMFVILWLIAYFLRFRRGGV